MSLPVLNNKRGGVSRDIIAPLSTKQNMLWNSAGSMIYLACQWLTTVLVVRLSSGFDDAGLLALAMSVVGIFSTFANYKMGTYQISDIKHENNLGEYLGFRCLMLMLAFAACMVYAFFTCAAYTLVTIALFFIFKAIGLLIDVLHGVDQQHRRMDYMGKSFAAQGISTLAAFAVVLWFTQSLDAAIVAMTVAALVVLFAFDIPKAKQFECISIQITQSKTLYFLKTSFPAVLASLAASAIFTIPKQYLAVVSGDAALGVYASVAAPALVIQMGAMYLYGPLLDVFPRLFFEGDVKGFVSLLLKTAGGIITVSMLCALVLYFIGGWALELLFGEGIVSYVYLLQPIILSTVATAFLWLLSDLLITLRKFKANFIGNLAAFVTVILLTSPFVNLWDMNGVSFAGAAACLVGVVTLLCFLALTLWRGPYPACHKAEKGRGV